MNTPLVALAAVALAQAFEPQAVADRFGHADSAACQPCHPRHYREWMGSVHAVSRQRLTFPYGSFHESLRAEGDVGDAVCQPCHGGSLTELFAADRRGFHVNLAHAAERGITCTVCHHLPPQSVSPPGESFVDTRSPDERRTTPFHGGATSPGMLRAKPLTMLRADSFCGPCHDVRAPNGLALERTWQQFLESPYPLRDETCTTCHMIGYGGAMVPDGIYHGQLHRHDVIGVDVGFNAVPAIASQRTRVERFLAASAALFVRAPDVVAAGDALAVPVEVVNSGAGHNLPAGFPAERRMWLEVVATLDDGRVLMSSGLSERDETGSPDAQLVSYTDRFLDASGRPVPFWWQAASIEERSLRALERRNERFDVDVPLDAIGRSLELEVRLRFQACSPRQLRLLGIESLIDESPIFDVAVYRSPPLPVRERAFPEGTVVVPDEAPSIAAALARVPAGGAVLVRPGEWALDAPLRFRVARVTLKSLEGPERTVLRRSAGDGEGSVLVFDRDTPPGVRVEGFTLTGGRGTVLDGVAQGGAIFCAGASPTLAGNRIRDNAVAGSGGGAFFIDSAAELIDNVFESNRAGAHGGGLAIAGASALRVRGGVLVANTAASDGGGVWSAAALELDGCAVRGNSAGRGGGVVVDGEHGAAGPGLVASGCEIAGNSAPIAGGLLVRHAAAHVEWSVIAGNASRLGGGAYFDGDPPVDLVNVTLTDNTATQWGAVRRRGDGPLRIRNSIAWANTPPELPGEVTYSLVEDERLAGGTNRSELPFFMRAPGAWTPCESIDEPGCIAVRWAPGRPPPPVAYSRFEPGRYRVLAESPAIDRGSPDDRPDPDDTRRDIGGVQRLMPQRGFVRGDVDGDGAVGRADAGALAALLFAAGETVCDDAADVDDSGRVDPLDVVELATFLTGGPVWPAAPFPACGIDPSPDDGVGCFETQAACRG